MSTEPAHTPSQSPPVPMLRAFLEANDLCCDGCGYNLGDIVEPYCPECGRVILRPSVDVLEAAIKGTLPHRLWCIHCQQPLAGVTSSACPACGKSLAMAPRETHIRRPNARWFPGIPLWFLLTCGLTTILMGWCIVGLFRSMAGSSSIGANRLVPALLLSTIPLAGLMTWKLRRQQIEALRPCLYALVCNAAPLLTAVVMLMALRLMT